MKLKMLREHYQSNDNKKWIPKRAFDNEEEIRQQLGFDPRKSFIYRCNHCFKLHVASGPPKKNKSRRRVR